MQYTTTIFASQIEVLIWILGLLPLAVLAKEGGIPTRSDAVLILTLGAALVSYRQACDKQAATDAD